MKPMLATKTTKDKIIYPVFLSPKMDGVRAYVENGVLYSRTGKPIRNRYTQALFGRPEYEGFDGELIVGEACGEGVFKRTTSAVMSVEGEPDVFFHVFDLWNSELGFINRSGLLLTLAKGKDRVVFTPQKLCLNRSEVDYFEDLWVNQQGYEGLIVRSICSPYKHGRSTFVEGYLLKIKAYEDAEAVVIGTEPLYHNENEAFEDEQGYTKRSSKKEFKKPLDKLGALVVKGLKTEQEFSIGTGFTDAERVSLWKDRENLNGKIVKYKFFPVGTLEAPRHPVFLGFRSSDDL